MQHPYLSFSAQDVQALRGKLKTNTVLQERYLSIKKQVPSCLEEALLTEEYANSAYTQHGNFYEIGAQLDRLMRVLGTVYLIEGVPACERKIREAMLRFSDFSAWTGPANRDRDVPWHSDLSTTRIAVAMAYGYDILYDVLHEEERTRIACAIRDRGVMPLLEDWLLPKTRIHALDSMGHNWWAVCIGLAGVALLPIADCLPDGQADTLFAEIDRALMDFLHYPGCTLFNKVPNYDDQGLFYESVGYFAYGTGELLRYLWHAERYTGCKQKFREALPKGMDQAILSFAYPCVGEEGKKKVSFLNFGDSSLEVNIGGMVRWMRLLGYDTPALAAYTGLCPMADDMLSLVWEQSLNEEASWEVLPRTAIYPESGYAISRSAWKDNSVLFAVKSGYTWNHAHADAGHFVLFADGIPFLTDSGCSSYGHPLYRTYYCKDDAHNVLLIGHRGQREEDQVRGSKFPGKLYDSYQGEDFLFVGADATGPYAHLCSRMYRNFLWIDEKILVIFDDVLCHEENTVQFLLHHDGEAVTELGADGVAVTGIRGERSTARCYHLSPSGMTVTPKQGYLPPRAGGVGEEPLLPAKTYLEISANEPKRAHLLLHAIVLNDPENTVRVEPLEAPEAKGLRIWQGENEREIWFNLRADGRRMHINSNAVLGEWETDAYLLMKTQKANNSAPRLFAVCASYLRRPDEVRFSDFRKQTGEW